MPVGGGVLDRGCSVYITALAWPGLAWWSWRGVNCVHAHAVSLAKRCLDVCAHATKLGIINVIVLALPDDVVHGERRVTTAIPSHPTHPSVSHTITSFHSQPRRIGCAPADFRPA